VNEQCHCIELPTVGKNMYELSKLT
jgi:hypothetical protein